MAQAHPGEGVRRCPPGFPHGAAPPPLRKARLGRDDRRDALLHPGPALCAAGALHAEGPLMIAEWRASGRPVAVVGLARSGVAATLLLRDRGVPVYASDSGASDQLEAAARELCAAGADV